MQHVHSIAQCSIDREKNLEKHKILAAEKNCDKHSTSAMGLVSFLFIPDAELWRRGLHRMQRLCSSRRATGDTSLDLPSLTQALQLCREANFANSHGGQTTKLTLFNYILTSHKVMKQRLFNSSVQYHGLRAESLQTEAESSISLSLASPSSAFPAQAANGKAMEDTDQKRNEDPKKFYHWFHHII